MPRFFFHTGDGHPCLDEEGVELADAAAARVEAIETLGGVLRDEARSFLDHDALSMTVTDEEGRTVLTLMVKGVGPPAGC